MKTIRRLSTMIIILSLVLTVTPVNVSAAETSATDRYLRNTEHVVYFPINSTQSYNLDVDGDSIAIAGYQDWNFFDLSVPTPLLMNEDADTITCYAVCEGDAVDDLECTIAEWKTGKYVTALDFPADGVYRTYAYGLTSGRYKIYVTGDADILKTHVLIVFSMFDTSILSSPMEFMSYTELPAALVKRKFEK